MYNEMFKYLKKHINKTKGAHSIDKRYPFRNRYDHSVRVFNWVKRINSVEKGDDEVVKIAAIFHDIGKCVKSKGPHAETSAQICEKYLKNVGYNKKKSKKIIDAIRIHSKKDTKTSKLALEDQILMDADILDELGVLSILWSAMSVGVRKNPSYNKAYDRILRKYNAVKKKEKYMKTKEGKRLFEERVKIIEDFLDNLEYELGTKDKL